MANDEYWDNELKKEEVKEWDKVKRCGMRRRNVIWRKSGIKQKWDKKDQGEEWDNEKWDKEEWDKKKWDKDERDKKESDNKEWEKTEWDEEWNREEWGKGSGRSRSVIRRSGCGRERGRGVL